MFAFVRPSFAPNDVGMSVLFASDGNDVSKNNNSTPKSKSRLAQLADDWLEEDEDELQSYWERFDNRRLEQSPVDSDRRPPLVEVDTNSSISTEERLERYYDSRGINKAKEQKYAKDIQRAIDKARSAKTPEQAISAIESVQPWLQVNTRLGGYALYELSIALWQRDGKPDELLLEKLLGNTHIKVQVQKLLKENKPPVRRDDNSFPVPRIQIWR